MDRLTNQHYTYHDEMAGYMNRLAAYEDTGLKPEEITALAKGTLKNATVDIGSDLYDLAVSNVFEKRYGISLDRLRELAQADKENRCVVLPCKVGDTVYVISHCENVMMNCDDDYETGTGAIECPFENDCPFEDCDDGNRMAFETTCSGFFFGEDRKDVFF